MRLIPLSCGPTGLNGTRREITVVFVMIEKITTKECIIARGS
ncbi:unnamed protein product [Haemonchus placei]|uniref:Uncharacterized protein n=1 Tax=Haemonchus placei TaxID=6290 RepID=A0A3P7VQK2_HAEPC|nr:unnamed protein product [Haemonchus placei]